MARSDEAFVESYHFWIQVGRLLCKCYSIVHVLVMSGHHAMSTYKPNVNDSGC